ncbi:HNH endonuclease [Tianweitania populi]|uniref:HNH endonuclease n=1 Tax=Tianweitania populi TaxID=1607949 RepID=A0A8J3DUL2_9HYPH|nr:HNH endonuclease [Tianweitania populi]GHD14288.1 hypothetical protein GCM10016234_19720 [Tianweitania populi]
MARRARWDDEQDARAAEEAAPQSCWLCGRLLGKRVEWHHPIPKSRGGRTTVPVHPICHRTIHATFSNVDLARHVEDGVSLTQNPAIQRFLGWIGNKPPDFNAPTRKAR